MLTIEVIEGPTKGQKFTKQVRPPAPCGRRARALHVDPTPTPPSRLSASRRCRGEALRKFPSRHTQAAFVAFSRFVETHARLTLTFDENKKRTKRDASQGDALQIGRTKSSAVYIKDPAVSQKHARVGGQGRNTPSPTSGPATARR